jgi:hypothetical protein
MSETTVLGKLADALETITRGAGPTIRVSTAELVELAGLLRQAATPPAQPVAETEHIACQRVEELTGLVRDAVTIHDVGRKVGSDVPEVESSFWEWRQRAEAALANYASKEGAK